ncbi:MAG: tRNA (adenosine(37)-N6)-dimethylallyltransferase MiaA [Clostridia bacterium]|nr:tRNA (adenosine(37)-N6)-dimethylallyltransferase MiaA [Clostridia bacterium]
MISALAITGPTASGKTRLSLDVARSFGCEIISCDSMQIYRGMDIGTAKATASERALVPHHLIDIVDPNEAYSAENYREDALRAARDITSRGRIPLFVGGTGLYLDTVARGTSPLSPPSDPELSARLLREASDSAGRQELYRRLAAVDPQSASKTHPNNVRRVIRALEIYELTGRTKTYFDELSREGEPDIDVTTVCLDFHNRETLYKRIDARVDMMIEDGLVAEVSRLSECGLLTEDSTAGGAIGYKELFGYLRGECTLESARESIKLASRRYAKRQLTWFRNKTGAATLFLDREDGAMRDYFDILAEAREMLGCKT